MSEVLEQRDLLDGQIVELRMGPPPANLVTDEFVRSLSAKLSELVEHPDLKLLVLRGQGENFSYGASIQEHRPEQIREVLPRFHALIGELLEFPVPTLAAVSGNCLGGGLELALSCSMWLADAGARFGFPEIRLGVFPPVGALLLSRNAPASVAAELVLGGNIVDAAEFHRLGIVSHIAPIDEMDQAIQLFAEQTVLDKSAVALRHANLAVRAASARFYRENIGAIESRYLDELMQTHDAKEGVEAFLSKREAHWKNN